MNGKIKKLYKHSLNWKLASKYMKDHIDEANTLSIELVNLTNFKNGNFFTLLPEDADTSTERLHKFKEGWIFPPNPIHRLPSGGAYSFTRTIDEELSELILKIIKRNNNLYCLFDDVLRYSYEFKITDSLYKYRLIYDKELYYLLGKKEITSDLIFNGLRSTQAFWHSLGVLTTAKIKNIELNLEDFQNIVSETQLIIVGAYDGEAYVFWEKKPHVFWEDLKA